MCEQRLLHRTRRTKGDRDGVHYKRDEWWLRIEYILKGEVVGTANVELESGGVWDVMVCEQHRCKGIATTIMKCVAKAYHGPMYLLCSTPYSQLYTNLGWRFTNDTRMEHG